MCTIYNAENLEKHNVTQDEINEVLSNQPIDDDLPPSDRGNARIIFVGFTFAGRLLEIGMEYFEDSTEYVFHAMDATKVYRLLFEKRKR